jgi:hypothetical protein
MAGVKPFEIRAETGEQAMPLASRAGQTDNEIGSSRELEMGLRESGTASFKSLEGRRFRDDLQSSRIHFSSGRRIFCSGDFTGFR